MKNKGLFGFIENPEGKLDNLIECGKCCGAWSVIVMEGALDACPPDVKRPSDAPYLINLPGNTDLSVYSTQPGFKGILAAFDKEILDCIGTEIYEVECRVLEKEEASMIPMYFDIIRDNSARQSRRFGQLAESCMEQALAIKLFRQR